MIKLAPKKKSYWGKILLNCFIPKEFKANSFFVIIEIISQLQVFASVLIFMQIFGKNTNNEFIGDFVSSFLKIISCNPTFLVDNVFSAFKNMLFVVLLIYIIANLLFLLIFLIYHLKKTNVDQKLGLSFKIFYNLHSKILFLPSTGILIELLTRSSNDPSILIMGASLSDSLKWMVYALLFLNFVLALFPAFLNFQPMRTDFYFSHRPCSIDFLDLIFKLMSVFVIQVGSGWGIGRWLYIVLAYGVLGYKMRTVLKSNPFHHLRAQRLMLAFYTGEICTNTMNVVFLLMEDVMNLETIVVLMLVLPLMVSGIMAFYKFDVERLVSSTTINLQEAHSKLLATCYILDYSDFQFNARVSKSFSKEELIFMDMLKGHSNSCERKKCYCKFFSSENPYKDVTHSSEIQDELLNFRFNHLKDVYQKIVDIGGDQCDVWIMLDYIALTMTLQPEAFALILSKIYSLRLDKLSKLEKFFVDGMISRIMKEVNMTISNINSSLDANRFFEFKQSSIDFRASLVAVTDLCLNFWNNYRQVNANFMQILAQSKEINTKYKAIAKRWAEIKFYFGVLLFKEYKMYSAFLNLVENSTKGSRELMFEFNAYIKKRLNARDSAEHITKSTIQEERNVTVHISMNPLNVGQVTFASNNIKDHFGWHGREVHGSNINKIIPDYMKEFHTKKLHEHLQTGVNKKVFSNMLVFSKHARGHVIPTFLYVTPHPDLESGFRYIGVLRPTKRKFEYVIVEENLKTVGWSEEVGMELGLDMMKSLLDVCSKDNRESLVTLDKLIKESFVDKIDEVDKMEPSEKEVTRFGSDLRLELVGKSGLCYRCEIEANEKINMEKITLLVLEKSNYKVKKSARSGLKQESQGLSEIGDPDFSEILNEKILAKNVLSLENPERIYVHKVTSDTACEGTENPQNDTFQPLTGEMNESVNESRSYVKKVSNIMLLPKELDESFVNINTYAKPPPFEIKITKAEDISLMLRGKTIAPQDDLSAMSYDKSSENFSNDLQQEKEEEDFKFRGTSLATTSVTSRASSAWRELHEINLLIQENPKAKCLTFITILVLLNSALVLSGTITVNSYASSLVDQNREIAIIMRDSTLRLYYYLEIHRRVRLTMMVAEDWIPNSFSTTQSLVSNYNQSQIEAITKISVDFSNINNVLVNSMHILDENLINELFQHVNLTSRRPGEPNVIVPISGAAYEYMQMMVTLQNEESIQAGDTAAQYILKNTLNDILIRSEEIPQILLNAVKQLDDKVQNILLYLIIGLIMIMAFMVIIILRTEIRYAREKSRFVYMLMRCEDKELEPTITLLKDYMLAMGSKIDGAYTQISELNLAIMKDGDINKRGKKTVKRVNTSGINNGSYLRIGISIGFLLVALAPLLSSIILFQKFIHDINNLNNNLVSNDNLLSKYVLVYIGVYEYLSMNTTSMLRNKPITEEFETDIQVIKDQFEFFSKINTGDSGNDALISNLMKGNLCDFFVNAVSNYKDCVTLGEGSATAGLFGITSYMTRIVSRLKMEFDSSDRSEETILKLLRSSQLREVEILFDIIFQLPFFRIDSVLIDSIRIRTDTFQKLARYIDVICIFVTLIFGAWGFKVFYIDGLNERKHIRMMLKVFPPKLVKNQGKIRNYLSSEMGNMFDS